MNDFLASMDLILSRLDDLDRRLAGMHVSRWLTTSEAADYLRCSVSQIERLTKSGQLPFSRQNSNAQRGPRLYNRSHLDSYLITGKNPITSRLSPQEKKALADILR